MSDVLSMDVGDRGASVSPCGNYRYSLWRRWDFAAASVLFVMLNPSTADASVDDPTIRRCMDFARRWGHGGIRVCNLYPWRATNPKDLPSGTEVGGEHTGIVSHNDAAILSAATDASRIVVAWGSKAGPWPMQPAHVLSLLRGRRIEALALTKHGAPWHPLFVRADVEPVEYACGTAAMAKGIS